LHFPCSPPYLFLPPSPGVIVWLEHKISDTHSDNPGLLAALRPQWPEIAIQRCTNHKLRNLLAKAPAHLREELAEDYRRTVYADSRAAVEQETRSLPPQMAAAV
jgi:transposase-like protein